MYCFRLEVIEVQPTALFAEWQKKGISFSIEAKLGKSNAGCRFTEFPSCFEIRSKENTDTLYMGLRRTSSKAAGAPPTEELYAEQKEDFTISGEHNPFGAIWIIMQEIGNEDNAMRANLMWEVSAITNTANGMCVAPVVGAGQSLSETVSLAVVTESGGRMQTSGTLATPVSGTAQTSSMGYEVSVAELKNTMTEVTSITQRGGFDDVPVPNMATTNPLTIAVLNDVKAPSAPVEVGTPFVPPVDPSSAYASATTTGTSGQTRCTSKSDSVAIDPAKTDSATLTPGKSWELDAARNPAAAETLPPMGHNANLPATTVQSSTSDFQLLNLPPSSVFGTAVSASGTTRYDSSVTNRCKGPPEVSSTPVRAVGKPFYDYYGTSTQVPLPPGCAFRNLYTVLAPPLVVEAPDPSLSVEAQRQQLRQQQQLVQNRIGDMGLSQRRSSSGVTAGKWNSASSGSALQSLKEERDGMGKSPVPLENTLKDAKTSRNMYMPPGGHPRLGKSVPGSHAAAHEDYISAVQLLRDQAMQRVERVKVVYT